MSYKQKKTLILRRLEPFYRLLGFYAELLPSEPTEHHLKSRRGNTCVYKPIFSSSIIKDD